MGRRQGLAEFGVRIVERDDLQAIGKLLHTLDPTGRVVVLKPDDPHALHCQHSPHSRLFGASTILGILRCRSIPGNHRYPAVQSKTTPTYPRSPPIISRITLSMSPGFMTWET